MRRILLATIGLIVLGVTHGLAADLPLKRSHVPPITTGSASTDGYGGSGGYRTSSDFDWQSIASPYVFGSDDSSPIQGSFVSPSCPNRSCETTPTSAVQENSGYRGSVLAALLAALAPATLAGFAATAAKRSRRKAGRLETVFVVGLRNYRVVRQVLASSIASNPSKFMNFSQRDAFLEGHNSGATSIGPTRPLGVPYVRVANSVSAPFGALG
jgi:hypothetical protein